MSKGKPESEFGQPDNEKTANALERAFHLFCESWFSGSPQDPEAFCRRHADCGPDLRKKIGDFLYVVEGFNSEERDREV